VDQAVDFILAKVARSVGTRAQSPQAPVAYELPKEVVAEAVVNAIAHRDYASNASVQVYLFADRLEIWNPGELPSALTTEDLRAPHPSIPRNPLIAEPLFLTRYIEKAGSGTLDMIARCRAAGLPEPDFDVRSGEFGITLWRDWLTDATIAALGLNERQKQALSFLKTNGRITNTGYQKLTEVAKRTAHRDLLDLIHKGVLVRSGKTGKGTFYSLAKRATNGPKGPSSAPTSKGP
jgi:predicted HTH transcriptional regulator